MGYSMKLASMILAYAEIGAHRAYAPWAKLHSPERFFFCIFPKEVGLKLPSECKN